MRHDMALWSRREKQRRVTERERTTANGRALRRMMEEQYSSLSTSMLSVTAMSGLLSTTFAVRDSDDIRVLPADRGRAARERVSTQRTLEPIFTDPPPLRPVRQFE
jgi:hypothetical protein